MLHIDAEQLVFHTFKRKTNASYKNIEFCDTIGINESRQWPFEKITVEYRTYLHLQLHKDVRSGILKKWNGPK